MSLLDERPYSATNSRVESKERSRAVNMSARSW
ncbi:Uncharacterised protein [Vibrio cholerae]|nr:Uncharacterised protein [Vibrio cholerae]